MNHILTLSAFLAALLLMISCGGDGRVIPKKKMSEIYADMFTADQWISQNYKASRVADTTMVYEAIFEKYGYDSEDYRKSVDHYIQDPDRFARILRQTVLVLEDRMADQKAELRKLKSLQAAQPDITFEFDFDSIWMFENGYPRLAGRDSLEYFVGKQEYFILDLKPLADPEEVSGPEIYFPQDSLITPDPVTDTLTAGDTLSVCDSVAVGDTVGRQLQ